MGFLQPALLATLALIAIPLLLHLFARRQVQQVVFPAYMLLLGSKKRSLRVLTLQQWLVLLCRMLAVGLLALAFAQPVLHRSHLSLPGTRDRVAIHIILDNSPSMSRRRGGVSLLDRAKSAGAALAARAAYDDEITVEPTCGENSRGDALSPAAAAKFIRNVQPGNCLARLDLKINRAIRELRQSPSSERRIIILSDFQANGFGLKPPKPEKGDPALIAVNPASGAASFNAWISKIDLPLFPLSGEQDSICFRAETDGPGGAPLSASLVIDGEKRGEQTLEPGGRGCFTLSFGKPGAGWGKIVLSGDNMPADNTGYFTFEIHKKITLALVAAEEDTRDPAKGAFYAYRALRTIAGAGQGAGAVDMTIVPPGSLTRQSLPRAGVVFIPDPSGLSRNAVAALGDFASAGGGVFITSGQDQQTASIIAGTLFGGGISISVPKREKTTATEGFLSVGGVDIAHPIFAGLTGAYGMSFKDTRFGHPAAIRIAGADVAAPASLSDGSALLAERALGTGRIVILASGMAPESTNLPLKPAFIPFILQTIKYLGEPGGRGSDNFTAGSVIRIRADVPADVREIAARNVEGGGRIDLVRISEGKNGVFAARAGAESAEGVYRLLQGDKPTGMFAVNPDPAEGRLAAVPPERFKKTYSGYTANFVPAARYSDNAKIASLTFARRAAALWFPALLGALLLLLTETVISNKK